MTKLAFVSDTHKKQGRITETLIKARADVLVHSGDFCEYHGTLSETGDFIDWCSMLLRKGYVKHVVVVAGNHDEILDETCPRIRRDWPDGPRMARERFQRAGIAYLQDSGARVAGLDFYGSPWVSECGDFAFQYKTPGEDDRIFNHVRGPLDVLVTHDPPYGVLDHMTRANGETELVGSKALRRAIERVKPRIHAFGHIHPHHGLKLMPWGTLCINACTMNSEMKPYNAPVVVDLDAREESP